MSIVEDDMIAISFLAVHNLNHFPRQHGIDMLHVAFQVDSIMEFLALADRISSEAIGRVDADEVQWEANRHTFFDKSEHQAVSGVDE